MEQKYPLYGIPVDGRAAHIEKGNIVTPEQVLAMPSTGNSRPLKRTYAVAGQQQCPRHQEKTDHNPLDLTDYSTTIPRATKWTKFNKLDRMKKPGLSEKSFHGLFVKCEICQRVTTRDVFRYHLEDCKGYRHEGDTDTSESEQEI